MSGSFFDTNVLLYLIGSDDPKSMIAEQLTRQGGNITVQVLNESANVLRRKKSASWPAVHKFIHDLEAMLEVRPVTHDVHRDGLRLAERYGFAIYDSFIVAAALAADCDTLWSEDMQTGMIVDGRLTITNPFRTDPPLIPAS
jgi:predicted nucleic acid-binding protein